MPTSFFPDVPARPLAEDDERLVADAGWEGPPWHIRPGLVALSVVLGRSESTVVHLGGVRVYPEGVVLRLVVQVRETGRDTRRRVFAYLDHAHGRGQLDLGYQPGGLRWGVGLSDGSRVTTLDRSPWAGERPTDEDSAPWFPSHPVLEPVGRPTAWADTWSRDIWLWPLPPIGPTRLVCEWTDRGIAETAVEIDPSPLRQAASDVEPLWP